MKALQNHPTCTIHAHQNAGIPPAIGPQKKGRCQVSKKILPALAVSALGISGFTHAALINLTNTTSFDAVDLDTNDAFDLTVPLSSYAGVDGNNYRGANLGGALLIPFEEGAGTGVFRQLFQTPGTGGPQEITRGYNRDITEGDFSSSTLNNPGPDIRVSDLVAIQNHYVFALDANQAQSGAQNFISIDDLSIYVGGNEDPDPLPTVTDNLSILGDQVWDLQNIPTDGGPNSVMLDSGLSTGAGTSSMLFALPTSIFDGHDADDLVYLYAKHGELGTDESRQGVNVDGFTHDVGGFLEWAAFTEENIGDEPPTFVVPEPKTAIMCALALGMLLRRKR